MRFSLTNQLDLGLVPTTLSFIKSGANGARWELGFIPWSGIERAHHLGRLGVLYNNDDLVGFCLFGPKRQSCKIFQIWIREDARFLVHGRALLSSVAWVALGRGLQRMSLWCADDLPAQLFWEAMGLERGQKRKGGRSTGRTHTRWYGSTITLSSSLLLAGSLPQVELASRTLPKPRCVEVVEGHAERLLQKLICDPT